MPGGLAIGVAPLSEPGKSGILKGLVPLVKNGPIRALGNIYAFVQTPIFDLRNPPGAPCRSCCTSDHGQAVRLASRGLDAHPLTRHADIPGADLA